MATFNQAYDFTVMTAGGSPYSFFPGSPATAATVWRVYCVSAGTITIGSLGSTNQATFPMAQGAQLDMLISYANVVSGGFLAVKNYLDQQSNPGNGSFYQ